MVKFESGLLGFTVREPSASRCAAKGRRFRSSKDNSPPYLFYSKCTLPSVSPASSLWLAPPLSVSSCLLCCFISSVFNKRVLDLPGDETSHPDVTYLPRLLRPLSVMQIVDPSSDERTQKRVSAGAGLGEYLRLSP